MKGTGKLTARELRESDIELVADYWAHSTPEHLHKMGVDLNKLPSRAELVRMLTDQLECRAEDKQAYCTIWEIDGSPAGHCNINKIRFGVEAYMHLHLWQPDVRHHGLGAHLVRMSLPFFFETVQLQDLYCEPNARNRAPNSVLEKAGFEFVRTYTTVPGVINFEQQVSRWHLSRAAAQLG